MRIPVILYDVPSRTDCPLNDLSIKRPSSLPRVIGLEAARFAATNPLNAPRAA